MPAYTSGNSVRQELKDYNLYTLLPATTIDQVYDTWNSSGSGDRYGVGLLNYYTWKLQSDANVLPTLQPSAGNTYGLVVVNTGTSDPSSYYSRIELDSTKTDYVLCGNGQFRSMQQVVALSSGPGIKISNENVISLNIAKGDDGININTNVIGENPVTIGLAGNVLALSKASISGSGDMVPTYNGGVCTFKSIEEVGGKGITGAQAPLATSGSDVILNYSGTADSSDGSNFGLYVPTTGNSHLLTLTIPEKFADPDDIPTKEDVSTAIEKATSGIKVIMPSIEPSTGQMYLMGLAAPGITENKPLDDESVHLQSMQSVYAQDGGLYCTSDERYKTFTDEIDIDFEKLAKLTKKKFYWKDSKIQREYIGVSAQEVQKIYPELVSEGVDGRLSVSYEKLGVIALAAIDKLVDKISTLEKTVEEIKSMLK